MSFNIFRQIPVISHQLRNLNNLKLIPAWEHRFLSLPPLHYAKHEEIRNFSAFGQSRSYCSLCRQSRDRVRKQEREFGFFDRFRKKKQCPPLPIQCELTEDQAGKQDFVYSSIDYNKPRPHMCVCPECQDCKEVLRQQCSEEHSKFDECLNKYEKSLLRKEVSQCDSTHLKEMDRRQETCKLRDPCKETPEHKKKASSKYRARREKARKKAEMERAMEKKRTGNEEPFNPCGEFKINECAEEMRRSQEAFASNRTTEEDTCICEQFDETNFFEQDFQAKMTGKESKNSEGLAFMDNVCHSCGAGETQQQVVQTGQKLKQKDVCQKLDIKEARKPCPQSTQTTEVFTEKKAPCKQKDDAKSFDPCAAFKVSEQSNIRESKVAGSRIPCPSLGEEKSSKKEQKKICSERNPCAQQKHNDKPDCEKAINICAKTTAGRSPCLEKSEPQKQTVCLDEKPTNSCKTKKSSVSATTNTFAKTDKGRRPCPEKSEENKQTVCEDICTSSQTNANVCGGCNVKKEESKPCEISKEAEKECPKVEVDPKKLPNTFKRTEKSEQAEKTTQKKCIKLKTYDHFVAKNLTQRCDCLVKSSKNSSKKDPCADNKAGKKGGNADPCRKVNMDTCSKQKTGPTEKSDLVSKTECLVKFKKKVCDKGDGGTKPGTSGSTSKQKTGGDTHSCMLPENAKLQKDGKPNLIYHESSKALKTDVKPGVRESDVVKVTQTKKGYQKENNLLGNKEINLVPKQSSSLSNVKDTEFSIHSKLPGESKGSSETNFLFTNQIVINKAKEENSETSSKLNTKIETDPAKRDCDRENVIADSTSSNKTNSETETVSYCNKKTIEPNSEVKNYVSLSENEVFNELQKKITLTHNEKCMHNKGDLNLKPPPSCIESEKTVKAESNPSSKHANEIKERSCKDLIDIKYPGQPTVLNNLVIDNKSAAIQRKVNEVESRSARLDNGAEELRDMSIKEVRKPTDKNVTKELKKSDQLKAEIANAQQHILSTNDIIRVDNRKDDSRKIDASNIRKIKPVVQVTKLPGNLKETAGIKSAQSRKIPIIEKKLVTHSEKLNSNKVLQDDKNITFVKESNLTKQKGDITNENLRKPQRSSIVVENKKLGKKEDAWEGDQRKKGSNSVLCETTYSGPNNKLEEKKEDNKANEKSLQNNVATSEKEMVSPEIPPQRRSNTGKNSVVQNSSPSEASTAVDIQKSEININEPTSLQKPGNIIEGENFTKEVIRKSTKTIVEDIFRNKHNQDQGNKDRPKIKKSKSDTSQKSSSTNPKKPNPQTNKRSLSKLRYTKKPDNYLVNVMENKENASKIGRFYRSILEFSELQRILWQSSIKLVFKFIKQKQRIEAEKGIKFLEFKHSEAAGSMEGTNDLEKYTSYKNNAEKKPDKFSAKFEKACEVKNVDSSQITNFTIVKCPETNERKLDVDEADRRELKQTGADELSTTHLDLKKTGDILSLPNDATNIIKKNAFQELNSENQSEKKSSGETNITHCNGLKNNYKGYRIGSVLGRKQETKNDNGRTDSMRMLMAIGESREFLRGRRMFKALVHNTGVLGSYRSNSKSMKIQETAKFNSFAKVSGSYGNNNEFLGSISDRLLKLRVLQQFGRNRMEDIDHDKLKRSEELFKLQPPIQFHKVEEVSSGEPNWIGGLDEDTICAHHVISNPTNKFAPRDNQHEKSEANSFTKELKDNGQLLALLEEPENRKEDLYPQQGQTKDVKYDHALCTESNEMIQDIANKTSPEIDDTYDIPLELSRIIEKEIEKVTSIEKVQLKELVFSASVNDKQIQNLKNLSASEGKKEENISIILDTVKNNEKGRHLKKNNEYMGTAEAQKEANRIAKNMSNYGENCANKLAVEVEEKSKNISSDSPNEKMSNSIPELLNKKVLFEEKSSRAPGISNEAMSEVMNELIIIKDVSSKHRKVYDQIFATSNEKIITKDNELKKVNSGEEYVERIEASKNEARISKEKSECNKIKSSLNNSSVEGMEICDMKLLDKFIKKEDCDEEITELKQEAIHVKKETICTALAPYKDEDNSDELKAIIEYNSSQKVSIVRKGINIFPSTQGLKKVCSKINKLSSQPIFLEKNYTIETSNGVVEDANRKVKKLLDVGTDCFSNELIPMSSYKAAESCGESEDTKTICGESLKTSNESALILSKEVLPVLFSEKEDQLSVSEENSGLIESNIELDNNIKKGTEKPENTTNDLNILEGNVNVARKPVQKRRNFSAEIFGKIKEIYVSTLKQMTEEKLENKNMKLISNSQPVKCDITVNEKNSFISQQNNDIFLEDGLKIQENDEMREPIKPIMVLPCTYMTITDLEEMVNASLNSLSQSIVQVQDLQLNSNTTPIFHDPSTYSMSPIKIDISSHQKGPIVYHCKLQARDLNRKAFDESYRKSYEPVTYKSTSELISYIDALTKTDTSACNPETSASEHLEPFKGLKDKNEKDSEMTMEHYEKHVTNTSKSESNITCGSRVNKNLSNNCIFLVSEKNKSIEAEETPQSVSNEGIASSIDLLNSSRCDEIKLIKCYDCSENKPQESSKSNVCKATKASKLPILKKTKCETQTCGKKDEDPCDIYEKKCRKTSNTECRRPCTSEGVPKLEGYECFSPEDITNEPVVLSTNSNLRQKLIDFDKIEEKVNKSNEDKCIQNIELKAPGLKQRRGRRDKIDKNLNKLNLSCFKNQKSDQRTDSSKRIPCMQNNCKSQCSSFKLDCNSKKACSKCKPPNKVQKRNTNSEISCACKKTQSKSSCSVECSRRSCKSSCSDTRISCSKEESRSPCPKQKNCSTGCASSNQECQSSKCSQQKQCNTCNSSRRGSNSSKCSQKKSECSKSCDSSNQECNVSKCSQQKGKCTNSCQSSNRGCDSSKCSQQKEKCSNSCDPPRSTCGSSQQQARVPCPEQKCEATCDRNKDKQDCSDSAKVPCPDEENCSQGNRTPYPTDSNKSCKDECNSGNKRNSCQSDQSSCAAPSCQPPRTPFPSDHTEERPRNIGQMNSCCTHSISSQQQNKPCTVVKDSCKKPSDDDGDSRFPPECKRLERLIKCLPKDCNQLDQTALKQLATLCDSISQSLPKVDPQEDPGKCKKDPKPICKVEDPCGCKNKAKRDPCDKSKGPMSDPCKKTNMSCSDNMCHDDKCDKASKSGCNKVEDKCAARKCKVACPEEKKCVDSCKEDNPCIPKQTDCCPPEELPPGCEICPKKEVCEQSKKTCDPCDRKVDEICAPPLLSKMEQLKWPEPPKPARKERRPCPDMKKRPCPGERKKDCKIVPKSSCCPETNPPLIFKSCGKCCVVYPCKKPKPIPKPKRPPPPPKKPEVKKPCKKEIIIPKKYEKPLPLHCLPKKKQKPCPVDTCFKPKPKKPMKPKKKIVCHTQWAAVEIKGDCLHQKRKALEASRHEGKCLEPRVIPKKGFLDNVKCLFKCVYAAPECPKIIKKCETMPTCPSDIDYPTKQKLIRDLAALKRLQEKKLACEARQSKNKKKK